MTAWPWTVTVDGLLITLRLTPKGGRDGVDGIETRADGRPVLKARVRTVPEDGAANTALLKLLAITLSVPVSKITLQSGHTARLKTILIQGDGLALADSCMAIFGKKS